MTPSATRLRRIAIVGNPNAGKTSIFNLLTGSHQKVANYPGVTVEQSIGNLKLGDENFEVIDVPGVYSINPMSHDETIAVETILGKRGPAPDLLLVVIDATMIERGLYFLSQLNEIGIPWLSAVTMVDVLASSGVELNIAALEGALGHTIIPVTAHKGRGITRLKEAMAELIGREETEVKGPSFESIEARYEWAEAVRKVSVVENPALKIRSRTDKIDKVLTHRVWGLLIFGLVMYIMFQSIYTFASPLMDLIEAGFAAVGAWVGGPLAGIPWLQSLVVDGVLAGIGGVAVFLPQILILFGFIGILEGTGYLARASFLMDRVLGWCGLNGKAFIPLLSSFACAIPGIMAARIMPDHRSRLATILVAPLMSCSARLPVYILLIGAVVEPRYGAFVAGLTLFGMHLVGLLVAIPTVYFLNRKVIKGGRVPFMMELPAYQWPRWKDVGGAMLDRAKVFVRTAGTVIFVMSMIIWAMLYFPRSAEADARYAAEYASTSAAYQETHTEENFIAGRQIENSVLGQIGRGIEPVFRPAGFDWRISTAILAAFPAREVLISSLGIIFNLGGDVDEGSTDLRQSMQEARWPDGRPLMNPGNTFGLMVFFALCSQCGSTLAIIKRETSSWKWPLFVFAYMTSLAWLFAVAINQGYLAFAK